jgi:hypothetical protein
MIVHDSAEIESERLSIYPIRRMMTEIAYGAF